MDLFIHAYIEAALWSSSEEVSGQSLDRQYTPDDIHPDTYKKMEADCVKFQDENERYFGGDYEQAGYDFWMTRNGHGVGFWEYPDWPKVEGKILTAASKKFGEFNLYVGDDGLIHGDFLITNVPSKKETQCPTRFSLL